MSKKPSFDSTRRGVANQIRYEEERHTIKQFLKRMAEFVIKNELKRTNARNDVVGELSLLYDSSRGEPHKERSIKFRSFNARQIELLAR